MNMSFIVLTFAFYIGVAVAFAIIAMVLERRRLPGEFLTYIITAALGAWSGAVLFGGDRFIAGLPFWPAIIGAALLTTLTAGIHVLMVEEHGVEREVAAKPAKPAVGKARTQIKPMQPKAPADVPRRAA